MHDTHHSPALQGLLRRQVAAPAVGNEGSTSPAGAGGEAVTTATQAATSSAAAPTTTTAAAVTTTSAAPAQSTTTSSAQPVEASSSSSSSSEPASSSSPAAQSSSSSAQPSSSTTTTQAESSSSSSSSSSVEATTSTSTSRPVTDETTSTAPTSTSPTAFTTVVVVTNSAGIASSSTSSGALASGSKAASSSGGDGSGMSTGAVVGVVAGALVGIVVLAAAAVWVFKRFNRSTDDDDDHLSPFDKDDFRRQSVMLDDVDGAVAGGGYAHSLSSYRNGVGASSAGMMAAAGGGFHSPQMSEHSLHSLHGETGYYGHGPQGSLPGLARGGTLNNPRPPTMIQNHYAHQQAFGGGMPSFQPGQIVNPSALGGGGVGGDFGAFPGAGGNVSPPPQAYGGFHDPYAAPSPPMMQQQGGFLAPLPHQHQQGAQLNRANSAASAYSQYDAAHGGVPVALRPGAGPGMGMHPVGEMDELEEYSPQSQQHQQFLPHPHPQERSGTPTNANVQQVFSSQPQPGHGREESLDAFASRRRPHDSAEFDEVTSEGGHGHGQQGRDRLSVKNGGLDRWEEEEEDVYGGMH